MRYQMASDKKKPDFPGDEPESRTGLDDVLSSLFERGSLQSHAESRIPDQESIDGAELERRRNDVLRAGLRVLLQNARVPMRDVWFGQWLKLVRSRVNVREDEVSGLLGVDVRLWCMLEAKPLQVTSLQPDLFVKILDLFMLPLPAAEASMRKGLAQGGTGRVFARTTGAPPDVDWKHGFVGQAGNIRLQAPGAESALENLVQATRQLLEAQGRSDLLHESAD